MSSLLEELQQTILVFDGAMGTELQKKGFKNGPPERFNLTHPEQVKQVHTDYLEAGSDILQTNTFGANRKKLAQAGLESNIKAINQQAVRLVRQSAGSRVYISGTIGPTGYLINPLGELDFAEAVAVFGEQARLLAEAGVDLINIETMSDIREARAALIGVKENTELPVICNLTFEDNLKTLTGTDPVTAVHILEPVGADILGVNCTLGPETMVEIVKIMAGETARPICYQPNAGIPETDDSSCAIFPLGAEEMAAYIEQVVEAGATIVGGCCGSTPDYIKKIKSRVSELTPVGRNGRAMLTLTGRKQTLFISRKLSTRVIGERINPSGHEQFIAELQDYNLETAVQLARKQVKEGADLLDVNMDVPEVDRARLLKSAVEAVQGAVDVPLVIDTGEPEILEAALQAVAGKPLINSVTGEAESLEAVLPLAQKYGAAVLGLTLDEQGIPETAKKRLKIAEKIVDRGLAMGLNKNDILIDPLTLAAGSNSSLSKVTLDTLRLIRDKLGAVTVLGISNISYGLPRRRLLNKTFISMALASGLVLPIVDPGDQELMNMLRAGDLLLDRRHSDQHYLDQYKGEKKNTGKTALLKNGEMETTDEERGVMYELKELVVQGNREQIEGILDQGLDFYRPLQIINQALVPGLQKVGQLYDSGEYFLPELIKSAGTAQKAFARLRPLLTEVETDTAGEVLLATVKGDLHDIGKNIVKILLENHGFKVVDLGKDVKGQEIVDEAVKRGVDLVGLSSLMTTTMNEMKPVVEELKRKAPEIKVMIGGAVVTSSFASRIGADGYGENAVAAVREARRLLTGKAGE
ncbi:MAG: homocysteine S-methyltransferase family protein [Bacillota bacterium]